MKRCVNLIFNCFTKYKGMDIEVKIAYIVGILAGIIYGICVLFNKNNINSMLLILLTIGSMVIVPVLTGVISFMVIFFIGYLWEFIRNNCKKRF